VDAALLPNPHLFDTLFAMSQPLDPSVAANTLYAICYAESSEPWGYMVDTGYYHSPEVTFFADREAAEQACQAHIAAAGENGRWLCWAVKEYEIPTSVLWALLKNGQ
jgi:hypothetical protein